MAAGSGGLAAGAGAAAGILGSGITAGSALSAGAAPRRHLADRGADQAELPGVPTVQAAPSPSSQVVQAAASNVYQQAAMQRGTASTILTAGLGAPLAAANVQQKTCSASRVWPRSLRPSEAAP